jgi:DNA-binding CsgD family transcriptional regulator/PAS domain-containing protein
VNPFVRPHPVRDAEPWPLTVVTDEDFFPREDFVSTEYFNDFLRPQEIHSVCIVRLARQGRVQTTVNLTRPSRLPQFGPEELQIARLLQPHLIRALKMNQALERPRRVAGHLAEALDQSAQAIFLLDARGAIQHANREAERLLAEADALCSVGGQLTAVPAAATYRLDHLVMRAASRDPAVRSGGSMAIVTPSRDAPVTLTVGPMRAERFGLPSAGWVMVCASDLACEASAPEVQLRQLFGLTAAETRVAHALFEGATPREAAEALGVSFHTVRSQLARIYEKTQTHRQSELMRLMLRTAAIGPR